MTVETPKGPISFKLSDLADGAPRRYLGGRVEARRVPTVVPLVEGPAEDDFPVAVADSDRGGLGRLCLARTSRPGRPPRLRRASEELRRLRPQGRRRPDPPAPLRRRQARRSDRGHRCRPRRLAAFGRIDRDGKVVVAWSEQREGNWDLFSRRYDPKARSWSDARPPDDRPRLRRGRRAGVRLRARRLDGLAGLAQRTGRHLRRPDRRPGSVARGREDRGERVVPRPRDRQGCPACGLRLL